MPSRWVKAATEGFEKKGTKGSFRKIAKGMGKSTEEAADQITSNPDEYPENTRKKAQFARNVRR